MKNILVVYESKYGQARKVAEFVADLGRRRGLAATVAATSAAAALDVGAFDAVAIVSPVYVGRHPRAVKRFLTNHAGRLSERPTAFISVSNSAASAVAAVRENARRVASAFVGEVGVSPSLVATAGGALAYPRYGAITRWVMKRIAQRTGAPTDTTRVHELTDWTALEAVVCPWLDRTFAEAGPAPELSGVFHVSPSAPPAARRASN